MTSEELTTRALEVIDSRRVELPKEEELRSLSFEPYFQGGHNITYIGQGSGNRWFVKFCRPDAGRAAEICEREVLVSLLGEVLDVPTVKAWVVPAESLNLVPPEDPNLIRDKFVLMPFLDGAVIEKAPAEVESLVRAQPHQVADLFAFMHWVGDEDRGLTDVMLCGNNLVLFDNGLCGPGRDPVLRGAHPTPEVYRSHPDAIIKKCYPGKPSFVARMLRGTRLSSRLLVAPGVIDSIEQFSPDSIRQIVAAAGTPDWVSDVLSQRCPLLRRGYQEWLACASQVCAP